MWVHNFIALLYLTFSSISEVNPCTPSNDNRALAWRLRHNTSSQVSLSMPSSSRPCNTDAIPRSMIDTNFVIVDQRNNFQRLQYGGFLLQECKYAALPCLVMTELNGNKTIIYSESLIAFLIKAKLPNPQTGRLTNGESTPQQTKVRVIGYRDRVIRGKKL